MSYLELKKQEVLCLALATLAMAPLRASACERLNLQWPAQGERTGEVQPELRWAGLPGGGPYRVQLALLLPEARLLQAYDERTPTASWRLPRALAAERAAVKVLVSRGCEELDSQDLAAMGPAFFIDTRAACSLPATAFHWGPRALSWPALAGASAYRLRFVDLARWAPGEPAVMRTEAGADTVLQPSWPWPVGEDVSRAGARAVVWQALCEGRAGEPVVLSAPAGRR